MSNGKEKILIVEDEKISGSRLLNLLSPDYDVRWVTSGEDALIEIEANPPDMILLDEELPGIPGLDVCRRVREDNRFFETKIVMISGHSSLERRIKAYTAGVDDFLGKPVDTSELLERVATDLVIKRSRRVEIGGLEEESASPSLERQNCWDFMACGRDKTGDCPAYIQKVGRLCWLVAGTMCGGKAQGTFAQKMTICMECRFYQSLKRR